MQTVHPRDEHVWQFMMYSLHCLQLLLSYTMLAGQAVTQLF